jgi:hypothetical protein
MKYVLPAIHCPLSSQLRNARISHTCRVPGRRVFPIGVGFSEWESTSHQQRTELDTPSSIARSAALFS